MYKSCRKDYSHIILRAVAVIARYSAFVLNQETTFFLSMPSDKITPYICVISCSRFSVSFMSNISSIRIDLNTKMIISSIHELFSKGTLDIHKNF